MNEPLGYFAAVATSLLYSFGSVAFTFGAQHLGSAVVNRVRLVISVVFVVILHLLLYGTLFPFNADPSRFFFLGISGIIGFVLGDAFLLQAFVMVGPRLSTLMMALSPVLTVVLAWIFLGESLVLQDLIGIALTIGGIVWVVSDQNATTNSVVGKTSREYWIGLAFGVGGAVGQAIGFIFSKKGLEGDFPALSGNLIRLTTAMVAIWAFTMVRGHFGQTFIKLRARPDSFKFLIAGSLLGPVFGVTFALYSVQHIPAGVSSTLQSLMPIFLIPIAYVVFGDKVTRRGLIGTVVALVGTAILFL